MDDFLIDTAEPVPAFSSQPPPSSLAPIVTVTPGDRLFLDACHRGEATRAILLLQLGANPNVNADDVTPAILAARIGSIPLLDALAEAKANFNYYANIKTMMTPLHEACKAGHADVVRFLIAHGASIAARTAAPKKKTCATLAAKAGSVEILKILQAEGVKFDQATDDESRIAPIHAACKLGHVDVVKYLLEQGVDVNQVSGAEWRPLHYAAIHGKVEVIDVLLDHKAEIDPHTEQSQITPLMFAARNYKYLAVKHLIKRGANVNAVDSDNATAVIHACRVGALSVVQTLVEDGKADVSVIDKMGCSALDEADKMNMWECALLVWRHGCDASTLKTGQGLGPVKWIRPRIAECPTARYHPAVCSTGSKIFLFGGTGLAEGLVNDDPDSRAPEAEPGREGRPLNDIWMLDMEKVESDFVVPLQEKKGASKSTVLSEKRKGNFLALHLDQLTVEALAMHDDDEDAEPTSIQATVPFTADAGYGYYEVTWLHEGTRGIITLGLGTDEFDLEKIPGWIKDSYGYHGDDGQAFHNSGQGKPWGPRYTAGDVVGCGINFQTGEVFFTKNGEFLGVAYKGCKLKTCYATIGFRNPKAKARLNFGATPFKFNFQVPMLRWVPLKIGGRQQPPTSGQPRMFAVDSTTMLLLTDFRHVYQGIGFLLHLDTNDWEVIKMDGARPWLLPDSSFATISRLNKLFMFVSGTNEKAVAPSTLAAMRGLPHLYCLDLKTFEWTQLFTETSFTDSFLEAAGDKAALEANIKELHFIIKEKYSASTMTWIEEQDSLCFLGAASFLLVDPNTLAFKEFPVAGARHNTHYFTAAVVGHEVEIFGGWDERRQQNEVYVLNTKQSLWYKPHVAGGVARPRNHHQAVVVKTAKKDIFSTDSVALDSAASNPLQNTYVVHLYGWNGRNFIDDFDVLALGQKQPRDDLERFFNTDSLKDVTFSWNNQDRKIQASRIILACRSSKFRTMFQEPDAVQNSHLTITLDALQVPPVLFEAFLRFLYTDALDHVEALTSSTQASAAGLVHHTVRDFVRIVEQYAPEHLRLVAESMLLTRVDVLSTMSRDLAWGFKNPLWQDVEFRVGDSSFKAHKSIVCARSSYMRALLLGGLKESSQSVIELDPSENPPVAFEVVLNYLYTQEVNMDTINEAEEAGTSSIIDVFQLACKYDEKSLKWDLEAIIAYNLSAENVCSLLLLADQFDALKLRAECCKFIAAHESEVQQADSEYDSMKDSVDLLIAQYLSEVEKSRVALAAATEIQVSAEMREAKRKAREERRLALQRLMGEADEEDEDEQEDEDEAEPQEEEEAAAEENPEEAPNGDEMQE